METVELLDGVTELIERWGWVQQTSESEDGLDLVAAFEVAAGVPLRDTTQELDLVVSAFADEALDRALGIVAEIIGADPDDGDPPQERWAWVHTITCFNDAGSTTDADVRQVLLMASELASTRVLAGSIR